MSTYNQGENPVALFIITIFIIVAAKLIPFSYLVSVCVNWAEVWVGQRSLQTADKGKAVTIL